MSLVKIGEVYINPDRITAIEPLVEFSSTTREDDVHKTRIFMADKCRWDVDLPISEVLNLLSPTRKAPL